MEQHPHLRVCIIDDHELIRDGLRLLLSATEEFEIVGEAGSLQDGEHLLLERRPHVAIVDDRLPDGSGLDLIRRVRHRDPQIHCLVMTSYPSSEAMARAVRSGASGYVSKDVPNDEFLTMIRRVARGSTVLEMPHVGHTEGVVDRPSLEVSDRIAELTTQERRILDLITQGLTNREIAAELFLAEKTIRNYVSNLLGKLGLRNRTQAATLVASHGDAFLLDDTGGRS